jgi:hypothetical protein
MNTLLQQFAQDFNDTMNELNPEERKMIQSATAQDWAKALDESFRDSSFWNNMAKAFVNGFVNGLSDT